MIFIGSSEEMAVYKDAQKYMEIYLAGKYSEYVSKKKRVISRGKTSERDSKVNKLYDIENQTVADFELTKLDWKASEKFLKKVIKSKTWKALCDNKEGCSDWSHIKPKMELNQKMKWAGLATYNGKIVLKESNCPYTILHELAHLCGNMHHNIGFRRDVLILASRFISPTFAKALKKNFKDAGLKIKIPMSIKTPTAWLESYNKMAMMRAKRDV